MVILHMKSASDKDEWLYQTTCGVGTSELIDELTEVQNARTRLRCQVMALWNLVNEGGGKHLEGRGGGGVLEELHGRGKGLVDVAAVGEKRYCVKDELLEIIREVEKKSRICFSECAREDAVAFMWEARDDPELKEDDRLRYWYFLELIDPDFKSRDFLPLGKTKLWWAGKEIKPSETLSTFTGKNEKSKIVAKLTSDAKGCPAREPKLAFTQQRDLRQHFEQKRDAFKELQPSELQSHKNVTQKPSDFVRFHAPTSEGKSFFGDGSRSAVDPNAKAGGDGILQLNTNVRHIHNKGRVETEVVREQ